MKLFLVVAVTSVPVVLAGDGDSCTFPLPGDSSTPTCVADDYTNYWQVEWRDQRCCQLSAAENINCDYSTEPISEIQCAAINTSNTDCAAQGGGYFSPGFVSSNPSCDDHAPQCLETVSCDTDNGYEGYPWMRCNTDGGTFDMFGCQRGPYGNFNLKAPMEAYLPYKYMNVDAESGNSKSSLASAMQTCDEINCGSVVAANGACNPLGECSSVGEYIVYETTDYTNIYPDVSNDVYVNAFRFMGIPQTEENVDSDQTVADGIRFGDLQFFTPMFDTFGASKGFYKYRDKSIAEINEMQSGTGLVLDLFGFTQSVYDYIVDDLSVDESLLTPVSGESKTTQNGDDDSVGAHEYFGTIDDGTMGEAALNGKFVGGPLICNVDNGQGCTVEGCAYMCSQIENCKSFSIIDFCNEDDATSALRPTCAVVDRLVSESGGLLSFDRSKRAVCSFHFADSNDDFDDQTDGSRGGAAITYENSEYSTDCVDYEESRNGICTSCVDGSDTLFNQGAGQCISGGAACRENKMGDNGDILDEWGYYRDEDNEICGLCPLNCIDCDSATDCSGCSSLYDVNDDGTGCFELGCTIDAADFPADSEGDPNGASASECVNGANLEPLSFCDIKCVEGFYQSVGDSLTATCNSAGDDVTYPSITCSACSETGCSTCPSDSCTVCLEGYALSSSSCNLVTCPLAGEATCVSCDEDSYGTLSWDSATSSWDESNCALCSSLLSNCLNCNGTSSSDAVCWECASGYVLDENDACIAEQFCPDGQDGAVEYDLINGEFDFTACTTNHACPKASETAPDCSDCPEGYIGSVEWVRYSSVAGNWSLDQCELVNCPTDDESSPSCTACPWGFSGTAFWDDETDTWGGCVSNDFGVSRAVSSVTRSLSRSTSPVLASRMMIASFSADGTVVEDTEIAPHVLDRKSSGYFYKNIGAFDTAESIWSCDAGYGGADCSLRLCPHTATSFSDVDELAIGGSDGFFYTSDIGQKSTATFHGRHVYRECAGQGVCDYETGQCNCFPGFTGRGCVRHECPNSCSGHGICVTDDMNLYHNTHAQGNVEILPAQLFSPAKTSSESSLWAADNMQSCLCDGGWMGHDCSLRQCPVGDDPETQCDDELAFDVQQISCTGDDISLDHFFSLSYTSPLGKKYNTPPIVHKAGQSPGVESLQTALESLPNFAIPTVEVGLEFSQSADAFSTNFSVTFSDPANTGEQQLLDVIYTTRCESGSSSYFVNDDTSFSCVIDRVNQASNLREQAECSNRGLCNTRTGECACYGGYSGVACETLAATI